MSNENDNKRRASPDDITCIDLTEDDDEDVKPPALALESVRKRLKTEPSTVSDDVQVLEVPTVLCPPVAAAAAAASRDDDIQVVGMLNEQRLPHMRQHCTQFPHASNKEKFCEQCYCYVCDVPVKECKNWYSHSAATDTGPAAAYWRNQRETYKRKKSQPNTTAPRAASLPQPWLGAGTCRHCNAAYTRPHSYTTNVAETHAGSADWCNVCGRVARARDLGKQQSKDPVFPLVNDFVRLGNKMIPFRLVTRDPRVMDQYKRKWEQNQGQQGWLFDVKEMEEEMFLHRFGKRPTLEMIHCSMPVVKQDKLPTNAEALLIDDVNHCHLLRSLRRLSTGNDVKYSISASWDKEASSGLFELQVHVRSVTFSRGSPEIIAMLGAWFGVFPFALSDLCGTLTPRNGTPERSCSIPVTPFTWRRNDDDSYWNSDEEDLEASEEEVAELEKLQEAVDAHSSTQTISPSTVGKGGICTSEKDFAGILRRFYQELLPHVASNGYSRAHFSLAAIDSFGIVSRHLVMRNSGKYFTYGVHSSMPVRSEDYLDCCLSLREMSVAETFLASSSQSLLRNSAVPKDLIDQLENLGHQSTDFMDGLNVELLPFQKQTVQWATERETTPGGIQSFTWAKLPSVSEPNTELYYNPALRKFSDTKPALVRGGFCCEEMGLGKTVISLALILQNPAPAQPLSGSNVTALTTTTTPANGAFWDPNLAARAQAANKKRGSILCRGTLVVCTVSLVGQWIDEAKSKLKDPGLVYPYHGGSRKRDPQILARNSIVVTTYETLASDNNYHKNRSKDPDYCAPCEQVRWWRIICDESHVLRNNSNKVEAVMGLVGDNKWNVTGTPICTGVADLKNQLKFLGLTDVATYIQNPPGSRGRHRVADSKAQSLRQRDYLFLLRPIMMRHSQQQTYLGTTTTLMSLPPKTETVVEVSLSDGDAEEYGKLENSARTAYLALKASSKKNIGSRFLAVSQLLLPLRVACAGGKTPLMEDCADDSQEDESDTEDREDHADDNKRKKRVVRYSKYAFTSKLAKLIEELERVREEDPTAKSLVFSQFNSTLQWLKEELPKHGFQYRTLEGSMPMRKRAKALHDFQHDPPTTIFLLSMRAGAVGINLTQANRVFLLEPCLNPALEMQAIGRVHRLGQKRSVEIIRLIVKDSVETRMTAMLKKKYGIQHGSDDDDDDDDDDDANDKKPAASGGPVSALVGSQMSDKISMVEEEFDGLFGIGGTEGQEAEGDEEDEGDACATI